MPKTFTRRITTDDGTTEVETAMGITTAGYLSDTTHSEFTASVEPLRPAGPVRWPTSYPDTNGCEP